MSTTQSFSDLKKRGSKGDISKQWGSISGKDIVIDPKDSVIETLMQLYAPGIPASEVSIILRAGSVSLDKGTIKKVLRPEPTMKEPELLASVKGSALDCKIEKDENQLLGRSVSAKAKVRKYIPKKAPNEAWSDRVVSNFLILGELF